RLSGSEDVVRNAHSRIHLVSRWETRERNALIDSVPGQRRQARPRASRIRTKTRIPHRDTRTVAVRRIPLSFMVNAQPVVQGQLTCGLPRILRIKRNFVVPQRVMLVGAGLSEA